MSSSTSAAGRARVTSTPARNRPASSPQSSNAGCPLRPDRTPDGRRRSAAEQRDQDAQQQTLAVRVVTVLVGGAVVEDGVVPEQLQVARLEVERQGDVVSAGGLVVQV